MDADQRALVAQAVGGPAAAATNLFTTLARHPGLLRRWLPFSGKLLAGGRLPARDREILILRTGWRCQAPYEWAQHVVIGRAAGLAADDFVLLGAEAVPVGTDGWDALLVRAADELHADACLSDATWAALGARYDERQLIEVPMVVGLYHQVSFVLNSLGVPLDRGLEDLLPPTTE